MLNEILQALQPIIVNVAVIVVTSVASYVGVKVKNVMQERLNTETKKQIAKDTVKYVEQVYTNLHGEDKKNKAIDKAVSILNDKNITITRSELDLLIESAVKSFNTQLGE